MGRRTTTHLQDAGHVGCLARWGRDGGGSITFGLGHRSSLSWMENPASDNRPRAHRGRNAGNGSPWARRVDRRKPILPNRLWLVYGLTRPRSPRRWQGWSGSLPRRRRIGRWLFVCAGLPLLVYRFGAAVAGVQNVLCPVGFGQRSGGTSGANAVRHFGAISRGPAEHAAAPCTEAKHSWCAVVRWSGGGARPPMKGQTCHRRWIWRAARERLQFISRLASLPWGAEIRPSGGC
jgi:hypothetical protein